VGGGIEIHGHPPVSGCVDVRGRLPRPGPAGTPRPAGRPVAVSPGQPRRTLSSAGRAATSPATRDAGRAGGAIACAQAPWSRPGPACPGYSALQPRPKGATHVSLARLQRFTHLALGGAVHPGPLADRPEPALQARAETTNGDGFGVGWYDAAPTPGSSTAPSRPGMTEPARAHGPRDLAAFLHPYSRGDRVGRPADELPSVPPRPMAVDAQRIRRRLRDVQTRCGARDRRIAFYRDQGQTDSEILSIWRSPSAWRTIRPRRWRAPSGSSRPAASSTASRTRSRHDRDHRRREHMGVPLLDRGQIANAVLQPRRPHAQRAVSDREILRQVSGMRGSWSRSPSVISRRVDRGARGELWSGQQGA